MIAAKYAALQERLRANLKPLPATTPFKRLSDEQEEQAERHQQYLQLHKADAAAKAAAAIKATWQKTQPLPVTPVAPPQSTATPSPNPLHVPRVTRSSLMLTDEQGYQNKGRVEWRTIGKDEQIFLSADGRVYRHTWNNRTFTWDCVETKFNRNINRSK